MQKELPKQVSGKLKAISTMSVRVEIALNLDNGGNSTT